ARRTKGEPTFHPEQVHLLGLLRPRMGALAARAELAADAVLLAEARHQFRDALAVGLADEGAFSEALAILLGQPRELLLKKWEEDARRARLQEQRIGVDVFSAGLFGCLHQGVERGRRIG